MAASKTTPDPLLIAIRWIARISSIIFISVFLLMFFGEGFDAAKITPREWISLFFFPFGVSVGMILAWWKEGLGGLLTVVSLIVELFIGDVSSSGGGYMLICASPGFLFLLSWFLNKAAGTSAAATDYEEHMGLPLSTEILETRKTRVAAGLCPKCGAQVKPADQNCPACRINLAFAHAHLDQW